MGKKKYVVSAIYYVAIKHGKVAFLGSDFSIVMERVNKEGAHDVRRVAAKSYREAAYIVAEDGYMQLGEEVQQHIKLLRGYVK